MHSQKEERSFLTDMMNFEGINSAVTSLINKQSYFMRLSIFQQQTCSMKMIFLRNGTRQSKLEKPTQKKLEKTTQTMWPKWLGRCTQGAF
jgi:hypothetical protein